MTRESLANTASNRRPRRAGRTLALILTALSLLATAQVAGAQQDFVRVPTKAENKFRFLYDPLASWPSPIFWSYNPIGSPAQFPVSTVQSAMQSAISKWRAACNIDASYAGTTTVDPEHSVLDAENGPQPDQINVLGWKATPAGIAGYTVGYASPSMEGVWPIVDSDVVVDPAKLANAADLERLLVHEFGHVLGVNHSQFDSALMSGPPYSTYNTLNQLTTDDIRACRCLYGAPPGVSAGMLCSASPVVDFGTIGAGTTRQQSVVFRNSGNASITVNNVTAGASYQTSGCGPGTTIVPGAQCTMQVTFAPGTAGDFGNQIAIAVGEAEPYRVKLVGSATGGSAAALSTDLSQIDFGTWNIGMSATTQRVRFRNVTAAPITIGSMLFEGAQSNEFSRFGQCKSNTVLQPQGTCTVDVGFTASASGLRSAQLVVVTTDGRRSSLPVKGTGQTTAGTPEPNAAPPVTVVEFYRPSVDHYFITIDPNEIAALDTGLFPGWQRTGLTFKAHAVSQPGFSPICRFYLPPPADSHFYSAAEECQYVAATYPQFKLESTAVMHLAIPNPLSGACPAGTQPIYRAWNQRPDTNHRYTNNIAVRDQMVALGWAREGSGPNAVTFCAPL